MGAEVEGWIQGIPGPLPFVEPHDVYRELHAALTLFVGPGPWRRSRQQNCKFPEAVLEPGPPGETVSVMTAGADPEVKDTGASKAKRT